MFVCISANPAIDKRISLKELIPGRVNRAHRVQSAPGGKAAHVAMVLRALGANPMWIGFAGGCTGKELIDGLDLLGIQTRAVPVKSATRCNLELIDQGGRVTELLEPGPTISANDCAVFQSTCESVIQEAKGSVIAILSGSLPPGLPPEFYGSLIRAIHGLGGTAFVDASGDSLRSALAAGPDLAKPNREEAEWLLGTTIPDGTAAKDAVQRLIAAGPKSAAVSLGSQGIVGKLGSADPTYHARPPAVTVTSAVGSGDASLAGLAYAKERGLNAEESLKLAVACGAANCLAPLPGQIDIAEVQRLQKLVRLEALS